MVGGKWLVVSERTVDARPLFSAQGSFPQSLFEGTNSQRPRRRIRLSKQLADNKNTTNKVYTGSVTTPALRATPPQVGALGKQMRNHRLERREVYKTIYAAFLLSVVFSVVAGFSAVLFVSVVVFFSADGFVVFSESLDVSFFWASK